MIPHEFINEIATFCFEKKINFEIDFDSEINSAHYEKEDEKYKFIISVCNPKDKNLKKTIDDGFENLKNLIEQVSGE